MLNFLEFVYIRHQYTVPCVYNRYIFQTDYRHRLLLGRKYQGVFRIDKNTIFSSPLGGPVFRAVS
jgi:hypothetical protein